VRLHGVADRAGHRPAGALGVCKAVWRDPVGSVRCL
jgi:hypothetical protein